MITIHLFGLEMPLTEVVFSRLEFIELAEDMAEVRVVSGKTSQFVGLCVGQDDKDFYQESMKVTKDRALLHLVK